MAEEKATVSKGVQASKVKTPVINIADPPAPVAVKGKLSEKSTRGTLDKR